MALGARTEDVRAMVVRQGSLLLLVGGLIGLLGSFLVSRLMAGIVFEIQPTDPAVFLGVPLILALVGLASNAVPAWRAARVDPVRSLRSES
jgi:putative ABC transport system permease protein